MRIQDVLKRLPTDSQRGFTVVELIVVMTLTLIFSGLVLNFALDYWGSTTSLKNSNETLITRQTAADTLRSNLERAAGLIGQNSIGDTNTAVSDPSEPSGSYWLTLHAVPQTISIPADGAYAPVFYYTAPSTDTNHQWIMNGLEPFYDEFVLYLDGSSKELLLRTLANPSASGNRRETSCPKPAVTTTCPGDRIVSGDISSVETKYFSHSGNTIDYQSIVDTDTGAYIGPDFQSVEVVEVKLNLFRKATINGTNDTSASTTVRIALRNG